MLAGGIFKPMAVPVAAPLFQTPILATEGERSCLQLADAVMFIGSPWLRLTNATERMRRWLTETCSAKLKG